jgi:hypothetical protein
MCVNVAADLDLVAERQPRLGEAGEVNDRRTNPSSTKRHWLPEKVRRICPRISPITRLEKESLETIREICVIRGSSDLLLSIFQSHII